MGKLVIFLVTASATFYLGLAAPPGDPLLAVLAPLAGAVALALAASGHLDPIAVAAGALGGLAAGALAPHSTAAAGAALGLAAYTERLLRTEGAYIRIFHTILAAAAGAVAGAVTARYGAASPLHQGASLSLAGALLAAPLLLPADDPTAHLLSLAARGAGLGGPALREAAELRRWSLRPQCPVARDRSLEKQWRRLAELVRQRAAFPAVRELPEPTGYRAGEGEEGPELRQARALDEQIVSSLGVLRQVYGASPSSRSMSER